MTVDPIYFFHDRFLIYRYDSGSLFQVYKMGVYGRVAPNAQWFYVGRVPRCEIARKLASQEWEVRDDPFPSPDKSDTETAIDMNLKRMNDA